jgi:hypothetical protein
MGKHQNKIKPLIVHLQKDLNLDIREFLKKYTKNLSGPARVAFLVFFLLSKKEKILHSNKIKTQWKKNRAILGKFHPIYITRSREYGYLKQIPNKRGYYTLPESWLEKIINREKVRFRQIIEKKEIKKSLKFQEVFSENTLKKLKKLDKKIYILASEANMSWQTNCWNSCGILMRIILERVLDRKHQDIRAREGLKSKINFSLSSNLFGKSIKEAIKKLDHSTKITGDIVAHDSNILLSQEDIELAIVPLNILIKDVFQL